MRRLFLEIVAASAMVAALWVYCWTVGALIALAG